MRNTFLGTEEGAGRRRRKVKKFWKNKREERREIKKHLGGLVWLKIARLSKSWSSCLESGVCFINHLTVSGRQVTTQGRLLHWRSEEKWDGGLDLQQALKRQLLCADTKLKDLLQVWLSYLWRQGLTKRIWRWITCIAFSAHKGEQWSKNWFLFPPQIGLLKLGRYSSHLLILKAVFKVFWDSFCLIFLSLFFSLWKYFCS